MKLLEQAARKGLISIYMLIGSNLQGADNTGQDSSVE